MNITKYIGIILIFCSCNFFHKIKGKEKTDSTRVKKEKVDSVKVTDKATKKETTTVKKKEVEIEYEDVDVDKPRKIKKITYRTTDSENIVDSSGVIDITRIVRESMDSVKLNQTKVTKDKTTKTFPIAALSIVVIGIIILIIIYKFLKQRL